MVAITPSPWLNMSQVFSPHHGIADALFNDPEEPVEALLDDPEEPVYLLSLGRKLKTSVTLARSLFAYTAV